MKFVSTKKMIAKSTFKSAFFVCYIFRCYLKSNGNWLWNICLKCGFIRNTNYVKYFTDKYFQFLYT